MSVQTWIQDWFYSSNFVLTNHTTRFSSVIPFFSWTVYANARFHIRLELHEFLDSLKPSLHFFLLHSRSCKWMAFEVWETKKRFCLNVNHLIKDWKRLSWLEFKETNVEDPIEDPCPRKSRRWGKDLLKPSTLLIQSVINPEKENMRDWAGPEDIFMRVREN